ncbi:MAG: OsmC family protein [Saprospiraceae bacterium]|nr:OsmC family protein [Saprospiraceae bacterium]
MTEVKTPVKTMQIEMKRVDNAFHFEAFGGDRVAVQIDAAAAIGGSNSGTRPMELILMGLGSCAVIDVILILKKMKQEVDDIRIVVEGDREERATPAPFVGLRLRFILRGGNLVQKKVEQAVSLSMEKYCSVSVMLEKSATIDWVVEIEI